MEGSEGKDEDGDPTNVFVERTLQHGDMVILVRPPSNSLTNTLLLRCRAWENTTIGVNPADLSSLHSDFDGDEGEAFVLSSTAEMARQASAYQNPSVDRFVAPGEKASSLTGCTLPGDGMRGTFMRITTTSLQDLLDGRPLPPLYAEAGGKADVTRSFLQKMMDPATERGFIRECLRGIRDVSEQQLTQGPIGDMARQARLSASCVRTVSQGGRMEVVMDVSAGTVTLDVPRHMCTGIRSRVGCAAMRAVDSLCSVAQQTALDAHKASRDEAPKYDMVRALFQGDEECVLMGVTHAVSPSVWSHLEEESGIRATLVRREVASRIPTQSIAACTDPLIVARVEVMEGRARVYECVANMVHFLSNYYGKRISDDDVACLSALLAYRPADSSLPVTHKEGCVARELRPVTSVFANHFAAKAAIVAADDPPFVPCTTVTERTAFFSPPRF